MKAHRILPASITRPLLPFLLPARWFSMLLCLMAAGGQAGPDGGTNNSASSLLASARNTETLSEVRSRLARERRSLPSHGLYEDIRGVLHAPSNADGKGPATKQKEQLLASAQQRAIRVVLVADTATTKPETSRGMPDGVLFISGAKTNDGNLWFPDYGQDRKPLPDGGFRIGKSEGNHAPTNLFFRGVTVGSDATNPDSLLIHILAREFTEPLVREALASRHYYVADDWLCDPTGFMFGAVNNQGVFTMGDEARMFGKTRLMAVTPVPAKLRLLYKGMVIHEIIGTNLTFEAKEVGDYCLEASLPVGGEDRPWIHSSPVSLSSPGLAELQRLMSLMNVSAEGKTMRDIPYREGPEEEAAKHKLDIYLPKSSSNAPVLFFIHGGAWKTGDRAQYPPVGNRYSREGYITVVPSYRLAPKYPHPAQIEDVAAAFAWTVRHIAEHGGDTNRIYVAGHSAGGHLAALLTLDPRYLATQKVSPKLIRGVLAWSGVYNLSGDGLDSVFGKDPEARRAAAPLSYVRDAAPPFLVTYCEWDYFSLPAQAREFHRALRQAGVSAELVYIPRESHISEMINVTSENDPTVAAAVKFMK